MLDRDLAELYQVKAIALRQQVKRNPKRFPDDFMFQLNAKEIASMVSQNVIPSKKILGGSNPYVFTEQGIAMLSSVLTSDRAIEINVFIMRAFARLRTFLENNKEIADKIRKLESNQAYHSLQITAIFKKLEALLSISNTEKPKIGFRAD